MKIDEFSGKFEVSYDTIRYYMKLNLIIPEKKGGHYYFNEQCERDMAEILKLKHMDFSLQEIKNIFSFQRLGRLTPYERNEYYQNLYKNKVQSITERIAELAVAKAKLEEEIAALESNPNHNTIRLGIDLAALPLFACPLCDGDLLLSADRVEANQVIEGCLSCRCGETLPISDGILYTKGLEKNLDRVESFRIEEYITNTNPTLMDESYQSIQWLKRHLELEALPGRVIMEPGSGYGHFLRQIYDRLPEDATYICIDNNPQVNMYLKHLLEMSGKRRRMIFLTADMPDLPLKDDIVDIILDFSGTSSYSFEHEDFLPRLLDRYLKQRTTLLATFIAYDKFGSNSVVAEAYRKCFRDRNIRESLLEMGFELDIEHKSEAQTVRESMGEYESFAQVGDRIFAYQVRAKREI